MRVSVDAGKVPGLAVRGEYGWDGWLGTYFVNAPSVGITILMNVNVTDTGTSSLVRRLRTAVYAAAAE
jgi:CubicO group peptidase (beta-lactamase class C family)